jgi:hypothetical protein
MAVTTRRGHILRQKLATILRQKLATMRRQLINLIRQITFENLNEEPEIVKILDCLYVVINLQNKIKNNPNNLDTTKICDYYKKIINFFIRMLVSYKIIDESFDESFNKNNVIEWFNINLKNIIKECTKQLENCKDIMGENCIDKDKCNTDYSLYHNFNKIQRTIKNLDSLVRTV